MCFPHDSPSHKIKNSHPHKIWTLKIKTPCSFQVALFPQMQQYSFPFLSFCHCFDEEFCWTPTSQQAPVSHPSHPNTLQKRKEKEKEEEKRNENKKKSTQRDACISKTRFQPSTFYFLERTPFVHNQIITHGPGSSVSCSCKMSKDLCKNKEHKVSFHVCRFLFMLCCSPSCKE